MIGGFLGGFVAKLVSTIGLWFGIFRAGQRSMEAAQTKERADHLGKRVKAEQETPDEASDLADDIRNDPRGF